MLNPRVTNKCVTFKSRSALKAVRQLHVLSLLKLRLQFVLFPLHIALAALWCPGAAHYAVTVSLEARVSPLYTH